MIIREDEQDVEVEVQEKTRGCNEPKVCRENFVVL